MATEDSKLQPLHKTLYALKEIRSSLLPYLQLLLDDDKKSADGKKEKNNSANGGENSSKSSINNKPSPKHQLSPHKRAEAEAAVALAIGTLRYMGARLKGLDRGRKKGDPLRKELDQIRGLLVSLRKIEGEEGKKMKNDVSLEKEVVNTSEVAENTSSDYNKSKRRPEDEAENDIATNIAAGIKKKKRQKTS